MARSKRKSPRLKDVAELAEVSLSAASRILRGEKGRFSDATCERVLKAAKKLGWRQNLLVSGMQKGRTKTIGVLIPPYDSFWTRILDSIHKELASADYLPITVWLGHCLETHFYEENATEGIDVINRLLDRRVDGLIMWPAFALAYYEHTFQQLEDHNIPVAVIDHSLSKSRLAASIETNDALGGKQVAEYLYSLGHRRVACLSARETEWQAWAVRRRMAFENATKELGAECKSWHLNEKGDDGEELVTEILKGDWQPTAIFAVTDHEAATVYAAAMKLGRKIPDDLSVIGFANLDFSEKMYPKLTTVKQFPELMGKSAARFVLDRLEAPDSQETGVIEPILQDTELVIRDSTSSPKEK